MKLSRKLYCAALALGAMAATGAHAGNLLTAGDFEGTVPLSGYWAPAPGIWGGESIAVGGSTNGVSPIGNQMLYINHAGGGTASQVHQIVQGPFVAGSEVRFEVQLNSHRSGLVAGFALESRSDVATVASRDNIGAETGLDADAGTWETFSATTTLTADANYLAVEIYLRQPSNGSLYGVAWGYAENAVLTVTPPVVDTDGDGVPDGEDACASSILSGTVQVGGTDTDVANYVDAQGCTVADQLDIACSGDFGNHGQFVSCVANAIEDAVLSGLLTEDEGSTIVSAAARSDVGKPEKQASKSPKKGGKGK